MASLHPFAKSKELRLVESLERKLLAAERDSVPERWQDENLHREATERLAAAQSAYGGALDAALSGENPDLGVLVAAHLEVSAAEALAIMTLSPDRIVAHSGARGR